MGSLSVPRLSIIIPTLGDWEALETTLVSVLQNRPPQTEVIVALDRHYQDPYDLKDEIRFIQAPGRAGLVELLNVGMAAARAEVMHVLACGATVRDGWTTPAVRHFANAHVATVAPVVLDADSPQRVLTAGCLCSKGGSYQAYARGGEADAIKTQLPQWVGPSIAAAFYRRSALAHVGLLDTTLPPELAAIDLALRFLKAGHLSELETGSRVFIESRLLPREGPLKMAWHAERLFWRYASQHGWLRSVAAHSWTVSAEVVRSIPRLRAASQIVGHIMGACDRRRPGLGRLGSAAEVSAPTTTHGVERRVDAQHAVPPPRHGVQDPTSSPLISRHR